MRLRQVSFAAVCDHGHLQDFPWLEWVHRGVGPFDSCANSLFYAAVGSGSLESIRVKCEKCNISRSLAGVMSGEFPSRSGDNGWSGLTAQVPRHQLVINGASGDTVDIADTTSGTGNWTNAGSVTDGVVSYVIWNHNSAAAQLLVQQGVSVI